MVSSHTQRTRWFRFGLRGLLLWLVIFAVGFAIYGHRERQRLRTQRAFIAITEKGVDAKLADMDNIVIIFKNGNVSDDDLTKFIPAFDERSKIPGFGRITELRLHGSEVTDEALDRFVKRVPWCKTVR